MTERSSEEPYAATRAQRGWLLGVLVSVYASNFVDRTIVNILQQPIKEELVLQDWQLGLLGGTTFAIFYTLMGIPVARLAEKGDRVTVLTVCILAWSGFTAMCALVTSFLHLLLLRIGVAVGEAGATPASHSLIADHYPPATRAGALAIFASGNTLGSLIGALIGATIGAQFGWRWAFVAAGAPGIVLALVTRLTLRDPRRATPSTTPADVPPFTEAARLLLAKRTFRQMAVAASAMLFASYAVIGFATPHLMRSYALPLSTASLIGGLGMGLALGVGTIGGGFVAQRLARRDRRWLLWSIAAAAGVAAPLCLLAFLSAGLGPTLLFFVLLMIAVGVFQGPFFGTLQSLAQPRMRATASALMLLIITLCGLGLGPLAIGLASDLIAAWVYAGASFADACRAGTAAIPACHAASALGLRYALAGCAVIFAWSAVHFLLAARTVHADAED